jgi:hypothetical protein
LVSKNLEISNGGIGAKFSVQLPHFRGRTEEKDEKFESE